MQIDFNFRGGDICENSCSSGYSVKHFPMRGRGLLERDCLWNFQIIARVQFFI